MFRFLILAMLLAMSAAFMAPTMPSKVTLSKISMHGGKGFGGGEATRDPEPTIIDPNDPKGKQQAIHKAETFAEYLAKRNGGAAAVAPPAAPAAPAAYAPAPAAPAPAAPAAYAPPAAPPAAPVGPADAAEIVGKVVKSEAIRKREQYEAEMRAKDPDYGVCTFNVGGVQKRYRVVQ